MRAKSKSFFEDLLVILVFIGIIYGIYTYYFEDKIQLPTQTNFLTQDINTSSIQSFAPFLGKSNANKVEVDNNTTLLSHLESDALINDKIDKNKDSHIEAFNNTSTVNYEDSNNSSQPVIAENTIINNIKLTDTHEVIEETILDENDKPAIEKPNYIKKSVKNSEKSTENISSDNKFKEFVKDLQEKVQNVIEPKKQKHSFFSVNDGYTLAQFTILKDGALEELKHTGGDSYYFKYIKNEVSSIFPITIDPKIVEIFPQTFEMKVRY